MPSSCANKLRVVAFAVQMAGYMVVSSGPRIVRVGKDAGVTGVAKGTKSANVTRVAKVAATDSSLTQESAYCGEAGHLWSLFS